MCSCGSGGDHQPLDMTQSLATSYHSFGATMQRQCELIHAVKVNCIHLPGYFFNDPVERGQREGLRSSGEVQRWG